MSIHPACAAFPSPDSQRVHELATRLEAGAPCEPVVVLGDVLLVGRAELAACELVGVAPRLELWGGGEDPTPWVVEQHLRRARLSTSQRALVAARLAPLERGQRPRPGALTQPHAASLLRVSERNVRNARVVLERGSAELVRQVEQGEVSVSAAIERLRVPQGPRAAALRLVRPADSDASSDADSERTERLVFELVRWACDALELPEAVSVVNPGVGEGVWARALRAFRPGAVVDRFDIDARAPGLAKGRRAGGSGEGRGEMYRHADWLTWQPGRFAKRASWDLSVGHCPRSVDPCRWVGVSLNRAVVVLLVVPESLEAELVRRGPQPSFVVRALTERFETPEVLVMHVWHRGRDREQTRLDWIDLADGALADDDSDVYTSVPGRRAPSPHGCP